MNTNVKFIPNPTSQDLIYFYKSNPDLEKEIIDKIDNPNVRIELLNTKLHTFCVFYIPEYDHQKRTVSSVELNIIYQKSQKLITIFAFNATTGFDKYLNEISRLTQIKFEVFLEILLELILENENEIIDQILLDTKRLKTEYQKQKGISRIITNLTQNIINIGELRLIVENQDKLLSRLEETLITFVDAPVKYKRSFIIEELNYAQNFSQSLMDTINIKYQVRMSKNIYAYTRYTFIFFLFGTLVDAIILYNSDSSPMRLTFWFASLVTLLGTLIMFRKF